MPRSTPDTATLLEAAVKYLEDELMPTLKDYHRFKTRVTINVLNTIRRELELGGSQAAEERSRLAAILGHEGAVEEMSKELAKLIRDKGIPLDDPALNTHLRLSLAEALKINNPKWLDR